MIIVHDSFIKVHLSVLQGTFLKILKIDISINSGDR